MLAKRALHMLMSTTQNVTCKQHLRFVILVTDTWRVKHRIIIIKRRRNSNQNYEIEAKRMMPKFHSTYNGYNNYRNSRLK